MNKRTVNKLHQLGIANGFTDRELKTWWAGKDRRWKKKFSRRFDSPAAVGVIRRFQ